MELVIITGISGAGKSRAIDALEDIGFYCIDNMPPALISKFAEICMQSEGGLDRVAFVTDMRGGELFHGFVHELDDLTNNEIEYTLIFLDATDNVLINRYKETRRRHPLIDISDGSIESAISIEREILKPVRERADYIIDTSTLTATQLKERISKIFLDNAATGMLINCMSFGFKYGSPREADLVFDVRCLPNPFYIDELKSHTGRELNVQEFVLSWPQSKELMKKIFDLIDFLLPLYLDEGKSQLTVAFGCTGGKHRSVTFAEYLFKHLSEMGKKVTVFHRDILKN